MRVRQTSENGGHIDEGDRAEHDEPEYWVGVEAGGGTLDDVVGFVKASIKELGTEVFGLRLIDTDTTYHYVTDDE